MGLQQAAHVGVEVRGGRLAHRSARPGSPRVLGLDQILEGLADQGRETLPPLEIDPLLVSVRPAGKRRIAPGAAHLRHPLRHQGDVVGPPGRPVGTVALDDGEDALRRERPGKLWKDDSVVHPVDAGAGDSEVATDRIVEGLGGRLDPADVGVAPGPGKGEHRCGGIDRHDEIELARERQGDLARPAAKVDGEPAAGRDLEQPMEQGGRVGRPAPVGEGDIVVVEGVWGFHAPAQSPGRYRRSTWPARSSGWK